MNASNVDELYHLYWKDLRQNKTDKWLINKIQELDQHELENHQFLLDSVLKISDALIIIIPLYVAMICCLYISLTFGDGAFLPASWKIGNMVTLLNTND